MNSSLSRRGVVTGRTPAAQAARSGKPFEPVPEQNLIRSPVRPEIKHRRGASSKIQLRRSSRLAPQDVALRQKLFAPPAPWPQVPTWEAPTENTVVGEKPPELPPEGLVYVRVSAAHPGTLRLLGTLFASSTSASKRPALRCSIPFSDGSAGYFDHLLSGPFGSGSPAFLRCRSPTFDGPPPMVDFRARR